MEPSRATFENTDLKLNVGEFLVVLVLLLLLVQLFLLFQGFLLLHQSFLNDTGARDNSFFQFFHDFLLYLLGLRHFQHTVNWKVPFLEIWSQVVIDILLFLLIVDMVQVLLKLISSLVVQSLLQGNRLTH